MIWDRRVPVTEAGSVVHYHKGTWVVAKRGQNFGVRAMVPR